MNKQAVGNTTLEFELDSEPDEARAAAYWAVEQAKPPRTPDLEDPDADEDELARPQRSPLLPDRHSRDFFVCDVFDGAFKGDQAAMEHPLFSLSKKPDKKMRRYENGDKWIEIRPGYKGLANVFDRDLLIYVISQLVAAKNDGRAISRNVKLKAHDFMVCTNRDTSGSGYSSFNDALDRLQGTQISTNIVTGGVEERNSFSFINHSKTRKEKSGRVLEVEIELAEWLFNSIVETEVLTLDRRYFQLAKPLERRLYELARKHCGAQSRWQIGLDNLRNKSGSQSSLKEFRRMVLAIVKDDATHNHLPEYAFELISNDQVVVTRKVAKAPSPDDGIGRMPNWVYEDARELAPGWDVYSLEGQWRDWTAKNGKSLRDPAKAFLAFCRARGRYIARG